jgi:hypothetical protein
MGAEGERVNKPITLSAEGYDELAIILRDAFEQASRGKGAERHANDLPFDQQPMQSISSLFDSDKGMAFQVVKKLREGLDMPEYERLERELLGSIVYTAGIILWHKRRHTTENARLVAAVEPVEPPMTFSQVCAEIDTAIQEARYPVEPPVVSLCPHCGRPEAQKHRRGCPTISTPNDQSPHTWDADCDVECVSYYPGFTVGMRYGIVAVNHESHTVTLYSDAKIIAVFGFNEAAHIFKLHSRPAK